MGQKLKDVMTVGVETVSPNDTIRHAAVKMEAMDIGAVPVCDGDRLVGVLTDRDIALRAVAQGRDPNQTTVRETMTSELVVGREDQDIDEVVDLMREREVRRLPVINAANRLVGIVALADLALRADDVASAEALEGVSQPRDPDRGPL